VASDAPDERPNSIADVAIATSKWFDAPIIADGAASAYRSRSNRARPYASQKITFVWMNSGIAIHRIVSGVERIISPFSENNSISVTSNAMIVTGVRTWRNFSLNHVSPLAAMIHFRDTYPAASGRAT